MPLEDPPTPRAITRLRFLREERRITQLDMALAIGISPATYRRLETGRMPNPPLRYLTNAAILLHVQLSDLIEDEWLKWLILEPMAGEKPTHPRLLWGIRVEELRRRKL